MITLYDLTEGEEGLILKIKGRGLFRQRLMEMGFIAGKKVQVIKKAPLGDPVEYKLMDYHVSLRSSEARLIEISRNGNETDAGKSHGILPGEEENISIPELSRQISVALVGNPNSGKTTLFNFASGAREKVANYAGVTVDSKEATFSQSGYTFTVVDLPGTYSLKSYSPEEVYLRNYILDNRPDVIVNVVDASTLERNLYLTTQLIDMGVQTVIALNMYDELRKKGDSLDHISLGKLIGIPVIPTVSSKGTGIRELFDKIIEVYENKEPTVRHIHINYGPEIESAICSIQSKIKIRENRLFTNVVSGRYLALELLETETISEDNIKYCINPGEIIKTAIKEKAGLGKYYTDPVGTVIADLRYGFVSGALKETYKINRSEKQSRSQEIDNYLTDKYLGIPIFIFLLWFTFFATFSVGGYPKHWLELGVAKLGSVVTAVLQPGVIRDFITDGIISGVGGVVVFLPNIIILFLLISLMEDTGYMTRVVFMMDRVMHKIGLHGKSFIPLFIGFGCNVPAIMSTRIIESRRDRLITMLITPFMSCSARLPVYILFISAFFPKNQGLILLFLYSLGAILAIVSAIILKKAFFRTEDIPFVMELPPYRIPTFRSIGKHVWFRTGLYLRKIGGVILISSIIIWILSNFPGIIRYSKQYDGEIAKNTMVINTLKSEAGSGISYGNLINEKEIEVDRLTAEKKSKIQEGSLTGIIGRIMEPVMKPLGFDSRLSVSILSGFSAKEVVVSTLGILYHAGSNRAGNSLVDKIRTQKMADGSTVFTPLVAFSFMIFILTYFPCIGVVSAIRRESGSWKWAVFVVVYTTMVAWLLSFIVFNGGRLILHI